MIGINLHSLRIKKKVLCRFRPEGWMISVYFLAGTTEFVAKGSDRLWCPHCPPLQLTPWVLSTPARVVRPFTLFMTEFKNEWSSTSTSPICFYGVDRNNFAFYYHSLNSCVLSLSCYLRRQSRTLYLTTRYTHWSA
jgi:hypothetical protein